jgi:hypothetical protein
LPVSLAALFARLAVADGLALLAGPEVFPGLLAAIKPAGALLLADLPLAQDRVAGVSAKSKDDLP